MWLLLLLVCLPSAACLRCHGMGYEDDANYLTVCKVTITAGKTAADVPTVEWNGEDMECRRDGCISSHNTIHCCCSKEMCNTVSYALAEATETGSLPFYHYYSYPVLAVVLLVQIIALTRVYGSTILRAHSEILPRHLHVSLTEFTASPMLSADELEDLPWSESKEEEEKSAEELVQMKSAVLKGVITYTCEYEGASPQTPAETLKRLEDYGITENSYFEEIFRAVLRCGPREVVWQAALAIRILREVTELFLKEPNVVRVNPPLAIYADLHGQYSDLWRWLNVNGWPARTRSLFMGDYVDRGRHCTEVYLLLALLKILYPENVTLLRGNHEDGQVNRTYSFFAEVKARFADRAKEVFEAFEDCFAAMPMTGLVGGRVLCLHGGLTPRLPSLADIEAVSRPTSRHLTKDEDFIGILWSDPVDVRNFQPNVARDTCGHGIGYEFGPPQIHKFCKENELSFILRGHQPPMHGYEHFSSQLVTLFSAPDYRREGVVSNLGGSMLIDAEGRMLIVRLSPDGTVRRPRRKLDKGAKYYASPPMRVGSSESEKKSISTSSELSTEKK